METRSDKDLIQLTAQGDTMAFKALFQRYEIPVFNFILRSTGSREVAQDLIQETFTRIWYAAHMYDPKRGSFKGWMFKIALNITRSEMAKKHYSTFFENIEEINPASPGANNSGRRLEQNELKAVIARALGKLPSHLREVIVMKIFHHLKFKEIAEITDTPEGTLKARFHRAVIRLKKNMYLKDYAS